MAKIRLCSVPGCSKPHDAQGYCKAHYGRWRRGGTLNAIGRWKESRIGFVDDLMSAETDSCITWPFRRDRNGYGLITVRNKTKSSHRFVCETMWGSPPSRIHQAAHSCGNGHLGCVNPRHLRWATPSENQSDKVRHGTSKSLLSDDDVRLIRSLKGVLPRAEIASQFGVNRATVYRIQAGERRAAVD